MALHNLLIIVTECCDTTMLQGLTMGFQSVYVWVRQLGAWTLHQYNSIALIGVINSHPNFAQLAHVLEEFLNFVAMKAMTVLVSQLSS